MDHVRFDSLTKSLAHRLSRRGALRGGAGLAAAIVLRGAPQAVTAADLTPANLAGRYDTIERYGYVGSIKDLTRGLKGLTGVMEKSPGFVSFHVVDIGQGEILMIQTFFDEPTAASAAQTRVAWIAKHASKYLPIRPDVTAGVTVLRSNLGVGCSCQTGVQDACNSDRLTCCATSDRLGGPGLCVESKTTCPPTIQPTPTPIPIPTATPTAVPTVAVSCTPGDPSTCGSGEECCPVHNQLGEVICIPVGTECAQQGCAEAAEPCVYGSECCESGATCADGICESPPPPPTAVAVCILGDPGSCGSGEECCPIHNQLGEVICIPVGTECAQQVCAGDGEPCAHASECCASGAACTDNVCAS